MILGGLILGNKAAPWLTIWVWMWNRNLMPSNFPTVPGWIFQSWSTSIFPWFFASREKCRHPSLGRNGPRVDTTYAWPCCPYMFVPKRMIFPETDLSERCSNLPTCHNPIIFHNETFPWAIAMPTEWQWRSPFNFMRSTPFKACQKAWKPPAWSHRWEVSLGDSPMGDVPCERTWYISTVHPVFFDFQKYTHVQKVFQKAYNCYIQLKYHITLTYSVFCYVFGIPNNIYQLVARLLLSVGPLPSLRLSWSSNQWGS